MSLFGLETLLFAATLGSAAVSAMGQIQAGKTEAKLASINASIAESNAEIQRAEAESQARLLEIQAQQERDRANWERAVSQQEAVRRRQAAEDLLKRQQTLLAASGGGLEGSAMAILASTAAEGDLQTRIELAMGEERARSIDQGADVLLFEAANTRATGKVRSANTRAHAAATRASGEAAKTAGYYNAGATLLSGVSKSFSGSSYKIAGGAKYDPSWSDTRVYRY